MESQLQLADDDPKLEEERAQRIADLKRQIEETQRQTAELKRQTAELKRQTAEDLARAEDYRVRAKMWMQVFFFGGDRILEYYMECSLDALKAFVEDLEENTNSSPAYWSNATQTSWIRRTESSGSTSSSTTSTKSSTKSDARPNLLVVDTAVKSISKISNLRMLTIHASPRQDPQPKPEQEAQAETRTEDYQKLMLVIRILKAIMTRYALGVTYAKEFCVVLEKLFPNLVVFQDTCIHFACDLPTLTGNSVASGKISLLLCEEPNPPAQHHTPRLIFEIMKPAEMRQLNAKFECACYLLSMTAVRNAQSWRIDNNTEITARVPLILWDFGQEFLWMDLQPSGELAWGVENVGTDYNQLWCRVRFFLEREDETTPFHISRNLLGASLGNPRKRPRNDDRHVGDDDDDSEDDDDDAHNRGDNNWTPTQSSNHHKRHHATPSNGGLPCEPLLTSKVVVDWHDSNRSPMLQLWLGTVDQPMC